MGTANKVQFGLKNVHFFPLTGADTYDLSAEAVER